MPPKPRARASNQRKRGTVDRFPYPHGLAALQFHQSGKFRVLQFADIQDGPKVSKDTISLIEASLDATRPDLVIFNGNQIAGYDSAYALTSRKRRWDARPASASSEASGNAMRPHWNTPANWCEPPSNNWSTRLPTAACRGL